MSHKHRDIRWDRVGAMALMTEIDGYCMVRRSGSAPFILSRKDWDLLGETQHEGKQWMAGLSGVRSAPGATP